eukprot:CAMPEP_0179944388 /NCGR_PEP_ID=MMETSP0983-20121128/18971_1 /TAXON_ID=483367 /ORGANISM="non described non described, Strain CCMP 2436" /LENGTH=82 /DNA_ID=CAMNT_0021852449 /DNA_START=697 /DNA_END=943 /DNA_ORIENTATION=+
MPRCVSAWAWQPKGGYGGDGGTWDEGGREAETTPVRCPTHLRREPRPTDLKLRVHNSICLARPRSSTEPKMCLAHLAVVAQQ